MSSTDSIDSTDQAPDPAFTVPTSPQGYQQPTAAVQAALAQLQELEDRPVAEHVEVFERVHGVLQDQLADSSDGTGDAGEAGAATAGVRTGR